MGGVRPHGVNTEKARCKRLVVSPGRRGLAKVYLHGPVGTSRLAAEFGGTPG